ncbi:MAG: RluA family pseudouridine synthase [Alphaproteobacteria bacterium]|nr:RluA family pseudouridine synthase [Alphaproteobacteria bacterium]
MDHSKSKRHVYIVDDEQNGRRLDRVIRAQQGNVPQALIEKWARSKSLLVNSQPSKPNQRLNMGDEVSWPDVTDVIKLRSTENRKQNLSHQEIDIVFRAKSFLVLNKPSGLASQGGSGLNYSVDDWLTSLDGHWKLVHRLDRATSGCLLVARGAKATEHFAQQFRERSTCKFYLALVKDWWGEQTGYIDVPLRRRDDVSRKSFVEVHPEGDSASTYFHYLGGNGEQHLMLLRPLTGRMHQLRVHMASKGTPIIGDSLYGGHEAKRLALHALCLSVMDQDDNRHWMTANPGLDYKHLAPDLMKYIPDQDILEALGDV